MRCAAYLPTSSTTGAGQSRKVSSIPAGLSSAREKQNQTLRHGHLDIYFNICSMVSTFLFSAQTKPESHNALQCKDLSIKAI